MYIAGASADSFRGKTLPREESMGRPRGAPFRVVGIEDRGAGKMRYRLHYMHDGVRVAKAFETREQAEQHARVIQADWVDRLTSVAPPPPDLSAESYVYCIKAGTRIKIGVAKNPMMRLRQMQTGNAQKLELVAHRPGGRREEAAIQAALRQHWVGGEWFRASVASLCIVREAFQP